MEPVSDRLEMDSLLMCAKLDVVIAGVEGVAAGLAAAGLAAAALVAGVREATLVTEGVGEPAREGGAVWVPFSSPSVRDSLDGRVNMPRMASHWK